MTNQENKPKKVPVTTYSLNNGDYLMIYPMSKVYHCSGEISGKNLNIEGENMAKIYTEIIKQLDILTIDYLNKASRTEEISLRIKENIKSEENPLEKLTRELGGEIRERKIK
jgi:hypothetical protein